MRTIVYIHIVKMTYRISICQVKAQNWEDDQVWISFVSQRTLKENIGQPQ